MALSACDCPNTHPLLSLGQRGPTGSWSQPWLCKPNTQHTCWPVAEDRDPKKNGVVMGPTWGSKWPWQYKGAW